jgi:hypothetical protein
MYVVAARFSETTWKEQCDYIERKKIKGCVYGTPLPIANSIPYRSPVFVLEMNFKEHRIMGVGLIINDFLMGVHHIYKDTHFNVCSYSGKYRVDREEMTREEEELMNVFDDSLFWKSKIWRTRNGLTQIPVWVRELPNIRYKEILRNMFITRFRNKNEKQNECKILTIKVKKKILK